MTLAQIAPGFRFKVGCIRDDQARLQAIRFGVTEGCEARCTVNIKGGPVVIARNGQELAIGRRLALGIEVHPAETKDRN